MAAPDLSGLRTYLIEKGILNVQDVELRQTMNAVAVGRPFFPDEKVNLSRVRAVLDAEDRARPNENLKQVLRRFDEREESERGDRARGL